jgi:hypothetical protein
MFGNQSADAVPYVRKAISVDAKPQASTGLCDVLDPVMLGNSAHENREALSAPEK